MTKRKESEQKYSTVESYVDKNKSESSSESESISITKLRNESLSKIDSLTPNNKSKKGNIFKDLNNEQKIDKNHVVAGSYEFEKIDSDCKLKKYYYRTLVRSPQTIINARENKKESEKEVIYKPLKYLMDTYVLNKDAQLNIKRYEQSSNHSLSKGTIVAPQNELVSNTSQFLATGTSTKHTSQTRNNLSSFAPHIFDKTKTK